MRTMPVDISVQCEAAQAEGQNQDAVSRPAPLSPALAKAGNTSQPTSKKQETATKKQEQTNKKREQANKKQQTTNKKQEQTNQKQQTPSRKTKQNSTEEHDDKATDKHDSKEAWADALFGDSSDETETEDSDNEGWSDIAYTTVVTKFADRCGRCCCQQLSCIG